MKLCLLLSWNIFCCRVGEEETKSCSDMCPVIVVYLLHLLGSLVWCSMEPVSAHLLASPCCSCVKAPQVSFLLPLQSPKTWHLPDFVNAFDVEHKEQKTSWCNVHSVQLSQESILEALLLPEKHGKEIFNFSFVQPQQ